MGLQRSEGADHIKASVEQMTTAGNQAIKDAADKSLLTLNELNTHSRKNVEAAISSVTTAAKCAGALSEQTMGYMKKTVEDNTTAAKALASARSVQEVVELQTDFARSFIRSYTAQMNQVSEIVSAAVKEAIKPLNERATSMMESVQSKT